MAEVKRIQYMCSVCGQKQTRPKQAGRPMPGYCPRKKNKGPHSWTINVRYY